MNERRNFGREIAIDLPNLWIRGEKVLTTCASAGTYIDLLPQLRLFYPTSHYGGRKSCTVHLGWLAWSLNIHFYGKR